MTMYGYEIRNEYALGAAELYKTAYQDDPEDILEGIAVAGLAGFLRQLGDLAEFAAGIFHGLHEEVTNTASRSQNITNRVQQLEADIPMAEKELFHNTYTDYTLMDGISWHPNLDTDSNIITKEEMPHNVMEFYKQSRGPPQLFRLDKFDKAGAGACLKRHTDPSFYRVDLSTYGIKQGYRREIRATKMMRKLDPISTDIARSLKMPQIVSRQEMGTEDQGSNETSIRRVNLKQKQFDGSLLGQMQNLLEIDSPAHDSFSRSISYTSTELDKANKSFNPVEKTSTNASHKRLTSLGSLINHNRDRQDTSSSDEKDNFPSSELLTNSSTTQQNQTGSPPDQDSESGENSDESISDATASEVEFLDALTTAIVDSEMETDSVVTEKYNPSMVHIESKIFPSERKEEIKDSTLLKSKSAFMRENGDEIEVSGTEGASAPISERDAAKTIHETETHQITVSFNKVTSKKVSYDESEPNLVTRNENGLKTPKLQKDSFSHSLRHMAKQLLELNPDITEDEEEDSQDFEENEGELLFAGADAREPGIIGKGDIPIGNKETDNVKEVSSDLIAKNTEEFETKNNRNITLLAEEQDDLSSHENELHGLQNIESFAIKQLNTSKEFGQHEVHIRSYVRIDGGDTNNITKDGISDHEMSEKQNLHAIKIENIISGENLNADESDAEENVEETDESSMDGTLADSSTREQHQSETVKTQNLTYGMQHGEKSYKIPGHGTETKRSIKEEVFYYDTPGNENLSSEDGEELCESEMHVGPHSPHNEENKTEKLIDEEVFDGAMSETENLESNEKKHYESEIHVGLGVKTAEIYELPVGGRETRDLTVADDFESGSAEFQIVHSPKLEEQCLENEMKISSDDMQYEMECHEMPIISTVGENLVTADGNQEILLQQQNVYHGDVTQIPTSEYYLDEERTLPENSAEPWDSHVDDDLSVEALADQPELLEEEIRYTVIQAVSPWILINDNILRDVLQNKECLEEEDSDNEVNDGGELLVPQKAIEHEKVDPVTVLGTKIEDEAVIPVTSNSEVISATRDPTIDLETKGIDGAETAIACNPEVIPDRVIMSPPIQSIVPTNEVAPEGSIAPPLPPLPPIQWRMGKPQMDPLPGLGPMVQSPNPSNLIPLPNFSKLGRPPRPKSSKVAARERNLHEVENEQNIENSEMMISETREIQCCAMSPNMEKDTSVSGFASVKRDPISDEKVLRYAEALVKELSVKKELLMTGEDKFEREMKEDEPRKKPPSVPIPPKYPLFQVTSHDNSMLKKAPTLIQPASRLITPSMLEEIKNKSFCLKPVMVKKPNFMAPYSRTNLKVAAMLEKANAIRQAVGSDDSDNDSWSE